LRKAKLNLLKIYGITTLAKIIGDTSKTNVLTN